MCILWINHNLIIELNKLQILGKTLKLANNQATNDYSPITQLKE